MRAVDLAHEFPAAIRARGAEYARRGAVRITAHRTGRVDAEVNGGAPYAVTLELAGRTVGGQCSCAFWSSSGRCKHMWATIVAAESAGVLADDVVAQPVEPPRPRAAWERLLDRATRELGATPVPPEPPAEILYALEPEAAYHTGKLRLAILERPRKKDGEPGKARAHRLTVEALGTLPDPRDRQILAALRAGATNLAGPTSAQALVPPRVDVPDALVAAVFAPAGAAGRLFLASPTGADPTPLGFDEGEPFALTLHVREAGEAGNYEVAGSFRREAEEIPLGAPMLLTRGGWGVLPEQVFAWKPAELYEVVATLRQEGSFTVPRADVGRFIERLHALGAPPSLDLPEGLRLVEETPVPRPRLRLGRPRRGQTAVGATLSFAYGDRIVPLADRRDAFVDHQTRIMVRRDRPAEREALARLVELGFRVSPPQAGGLIEIGSVAIAGAVRALVSAGWHVDAEGAIYRAAGDFKMNVRSGIDWFDLQGTLDFGGVTASLPALLAAASGDGVVTLDDGSLGVLPEEWLARHGLLGALGELSPDGLRFRRSQAALLDLLLADAPAVELDEPFLRTRDELSRFSGVTPKAAPPGFQGALRPYQEVGLGWMDFLERFGFGGCLADDMGLGKTVQVLAHLDGRTADRPSLVVLPKSLVWNWRDEAARFTPSMKIVAHSGKDRPRTVAELAEADLVLTTYGLLRTDINLLREVEFDYVILDEAQAVKNAGSATAKAARLLRAQHRLALSGTPVENHIGELWSLFEFLNPGMLGTANVFRGLSGGTRPSEEQVALVARALRPYILRRTKEQVAKELPPKHEETIRCELEGEQRRLYDELREHYRESVLSRIDRHGLAKSHMHVLEALLRLRQAACHPALVAADRAEIGSAKLDVLVPRLHELREEGHKALVFSQFTSLLDIVAARLDAEGIVYERLDGRTRDRQERVERFQTDPACPVFLLSLKAGGVGLNLTAAEYVFVLDPWWNPAAEAQAVDRTHRIGQTRSVFAYRLIAKDTVEEKIAALQEEKRKLAEALVGDGNAAVESLDRETIEMLLG